MKTLFFMVIAIALVASFASALNTSAPSEPATVALSPTDAPQSTENRSLTYDDIAKTGKPQFLDAYATWCPYCQQNQPTVFALRAQFKGEVDFIHLNVDTPGVLEATAPYTLTGVTQYALIDAEGNIIEKWFGTLREDEVADSISAFLDGV